MIINNAASRCDPDFWTKHLLNDKKNTRAELRDIRGLAADNLRDALLEMRDDAWFAPRCENFMYHADFNPRRDEQLTEEQWEQMFEIFEKHRGIPAGQPRVVVEHEKNGRTHRHVIWQRVDLETLRAFPDGLDWKVAHAAAREIEKELGLQRTIGPLDREKGTPRPPRAPEAWEMYRGMKTGIDPRDVTAEVTELFRQSDNGKAFQAALEGHGYMLLKGDRRGFVILDSAGKDHSLARRLNGINTKQLNAFMHDIDREALPSVEQGRALHQERKLVRLEHELADAQKQLEENRNQPNRTKETRAGSWERVREKGWPVIALTREPIRRAPKDHVQDAARAATNDRSSAPPVPLKGRAPAVIRRAVTTLPNVAIGAIAKPLDLLGNMLEGIAAPKFTPEQIREGERAMQRREAETGSEIDFRKYTADMAQQRQQQENEQEAARRRHREVDRER